MDTPAAYGLTMLVRTPTPTPTPLTQHEFFQQATHRCLGVSPHLLASSGINHTPAHWRENYEFLGETSSFAMPARTEYYVQVRDLNASAPREAYGKFCFTARGATPEACLADLLAQLRELEARAYEADPTRAGEQHSEMYQDLAAYDYAA